MKVLQINNVYGIGSTGKLTQILHKALTEDGIDSVVLYGRGPTAQEEHVYRMCGNLYGKANSLISRITGVPYGGCRWSTKRIIRTIIKEKPDVVHVQCINGNFVNIYKLITWLKQSGIPTVLTLHAEFMYTANCGHAFDCEKWKTGCGQCPRLYKATKSIWFDGTHRSFQKMKRAFEGFDTVNIVSVSPWLMERAKSSPILAGNSHDTILNGVDTEIFHPYAVNQMEHMDQAQGRFVIFHATAMFRDQPDDPKGGAFVLELARRLQDLPVLFLVAGKAEVSCALPRNVVLLGEIKDQVLLAKYYSMASLTLLTSRRETYSMVCAESLCCGTPVLGFRAGAPEQISLPRYSRFVPFGDMDALEEGARQMLKSHHLFSPQKAAEDAARAYNKEAMVQSYENIYWRTKCSE